MLKVATVFSGIGAVEQALKRMDVKNEIMFACDNGGIDLWKNKTIEEKNETIEKINNIENHYEKKEFVDNLYKNSRKTNFVEQSYLANYNIDNTRFYQDITFLDGEQFKGEIDLFVGGSPCQSFSVAGQRGGLEDTRGTLFYEFARLVKEIQPKVFIYENVKGLLNHDKGKTWEVVQNVFEDLGYTYYFKVLNAKDYEIPQSRNRIFVVGFKNDIKFEFPEKIELKTKLKDYLEKDVDEKYFLSKKGVFSVSTEKAIKKKYTQINGEIALCQMAQQQFNLRGDFIREDEGEITEDSRIRKLTPRECLRLMGFEEDFKQVVSDLQMYRQCGNSIVVDVLIHILNEIFKTEVF